MRILAWWQDWVSKDNSSEVAVCGALLHGFLNLVCSGCCFCRLRFKLYMACTVVNSRNWSWLFEWVDNMPNIAGMLGQSQNVRPVKPKWDGFLLPRRRRWSLNRFGEYGVPRLLMIHGRTRFWTTFLDFCS